MMRGTTPTFRFIFKHNLDKVTKAVATFACNRETIVEKELKDMLVDGDTIVLQLTQEETLLFPQNSIIELQLAIAAESGNDNSMPLVGRSKIWRIPSERILREGLL